jgi:hypothetical protein
VSRALPLVLLAALAVGPGAVGPGARAQGERLAPPLPDTTAGLYGSSAALVLVLSEYGLGAGGALRARVTDDLSFATELSVGAGRDERERQFFGDVIGGTVTPFKRNYVLLVPLHLGLERRLFRARIEDNFRPYVHASLGPTLGYQWPYFDDLDGDGRLGPTEERVGVFGRIADGEARLGVGGLAAVGAFLGRGRRPLALRFGLRGTYFPAEIDLLEIRDDVEDPSRKTFWTPVVSLHVARLL